MKYIIAEIQIANKTTLKCMILNDKF